MPGLSLGFGAVGFSTSEKKDTHTAKPKPHIIDALDGKSVRASKKNRAN